MRKLFVNGKIRTIDKDNHLVTAFAVEDGKFIAVGTEEEVRKAAGNCETIDLQGRDVLPGFVDAHLHFWTTRSTNYLLQIFMIPKVPTNWLML